MRVTLLAVTGLRREATEILSDQPFGEVFAADHLAELAGRACYESWDRPNPKTADNDAYLAHILEVGHYSVLEHAGAAFYVEHVSRSLTHELVRHRHLSFSQRSQRYVNEEESGWVIPEAVQTISDTDIRAMVTDEINVLNQRARLSYRMIVDELTKQGFPRKRAREAARAVLPNSTHTSVVVSGNHRAWREMLSKRWHVAADAEIRALAGVLLGHLSEIAPSIYQDFSRDRPIGMPASGE